MRGKVARKMPEWYEERITPAYAGKSEIRLQRV